LMSPAAACRGDKLAYPAGSLRDAAAPQQQQQQEEGDAGSPGVSPQRCTAEVLEAPGGVGLQVLLTAGLAQAQALVIGSSPELKHEEADAEVGARGGSAWGWQVCLWVCGGLPRVLCNALRRQPSNCLAGGTACWIAGMVLLCSHCGATTVEPL
jgi:hypothetical protein